MIKKHLTLIFILIFIITLSMNECGSTVYMEYKPTMELEEKIFRLLEATIKEGDTYEIFIKRLESYQQLLFEYKSLYVLNCEYLVSTTANSYCFHTPQMDYLLTLGKDNDLLIKYLKMYIDVSNNNNKIAVAQKLITHLCSK